MADADAAVTEAYLQHLGEHDLRLLLDATAADRAGADLGDRPAAAFRARPGLLDHVLGRPAVRHALFGPGAEALGPRMPSPFLVFSVAVHGVAHDLAGAGHVSEWIGPHQRLPVFDTTDLRDFLADGWRRFVLAELLASYTHVASGSVLVATRRGWRRQRFSELDPVRMAGLLDVVPDSERPGVYRRLGDLTLFLTGVFPDHTALRGLGPLDAGRLLRAGRPSPGRPDSVAAAAAGAGNAVSLFEELGRRWYLLAHRSLPVPAPTGLHVLGELAERFGAARRVLNLVTEGYLFRVRDRWFGFGRP